MVTKSRKNNLTTKRLVDSKKSRKVVSVTVEPAKIAIVEPTVLKSIVEKINRDNHVHMSIHLDKIKDCFDKICSIILYFLPFLSFRFLVPAKKPKTMPVMVMYLAVFVFAIAYFFVLMDFRKCKKRSDGSFEGCEIYSEYNQQNLLKNTIVEALYSSHVTYAYPQYLLNYLITIPIFQSFKSRSPLLYKLFGTKIREVGFTLFNFKVYPDSTPSKVLEASMDAAKKSLFDFKAYRLVNL